MSYTPPAYNATDFDLVSGYSVPAYNAVDFSWQFGLVAQILGVSSVSFSAVAIGTSVFAVVGGCVATPAVLAIPTSTMNISSATTVAFETSSRDLSITTATGGSFIARGITGAPASISGTATAYFERYYPPPIQGVTTFAPVGGGVTSVYFYARGKSEGAFSASFEKQTKAVVFGRAILSVKTNVIRPLLFSVNSAATQALVGRSVFSSLASIHGSASLESALGGVQGTQTTIPSISATNFFVDRVGAGTANISGVAAVHADVAYTTVPVTPYNPEYDTVFVASKRQEVFVRGV